MLPWLFGVLETERSPALLGWLPAASSLLHRSKVGMEQLHLRGHGCHQSVSVAKLKKAS